MTIPWLSGVSLQQGGPVGLVKATERLLWSLGFDDVRVIDGSGDQGADVLAVRRNEQWIIQCKWTKRGTVGTDGVEEVASAYTTYRADYAVLVTNTDLSRPAKERVAVLKGIGVRLDLWNGSTLERIGAALANEFPTGKKLRNYQIEAVESILSDLDKHNSALLMLATGLGKTVVGGNVISRVISADPNAKVLVVSHLRELAQQLEKAMWQHVPNTVRTNLLTGESKPDDLSGLTSATVESAINAVYDGYRPDIIMIDEAHHVGSSGRYRELLSLTQGVPFFGVTATPWRGDEFDLTDIFGPPSYILGIAEGMRQGFLVGMDYRLLVDNFNWDLVRDKSRYGYSIRELNQRLFLPQRDAEIINLVYQTWNLIVDPRAILFCQTIEHAESLAQQLRQHSPAWARAAAIHSGQSMQDRNRLLNEFRLGRTPILTSVDVLNEGVDVPDVNLIAFLRVTHSRRIFVQQLGRGLRLREGKLRLIVLDFVTDLRRVAAALQLERDLTGEREDLLLDDSMARQIHFSNETAGSFLDHWIRDAANLETAADDVRLQFPESISN